MTNERCSTYVRCISNPELDRHFLSGVERVLFDFSPFDALVASFEEALDALVSVQIKPKKIVLEGFSVDSEGSHLVTYATAVFGTFNWEKIVEGFPILSEKGSNPYSYEMTVPKKVNEVESPIGKSPKIFRDKAR